MCMVLKQRGEGSVHAQLSTCQLGLNSDGPGIGRPRGIALQITNPALSTSPSVLLCIKKKKDIFVGT